MTALPLTPRSLISYCVMTLTKTLTKPRKRTRLSPDDRRTQLVDIGTKLFAERGLGDVWVDEVAEAAQVSRGLIYHYFPTKRDFYLAVVQRSVEEFLHKTAPDPTLIGIERVHKGLDVMFEYVDQHRNAYLAVSMAATSGDPEVREIVEQMRAKGVERICRSIVGDGAIPPLMWLAIAGWQASMIAICIEWIENTSVSRQQLVELSYGTFVGTIGALAETMPELKDTLIEAAAGYGKQ